MTRYNWQQPDWPRFRYDLQGVEDLLLRFAEKAGRVSGIMEALPANTQQDVIVETMLAEALKTSEIEGEFPNKKAVLSSIRKNLGLHTDPKYVKDKSAAGLAELMIDVRKTFNHPLTEEKLFEWHRMLMRQHTRIKAGKWRTHKDPMQVISGAIGKEKVHFEAPPSKRVPEEMSAFIQWFNDTAPGGRHELKKSPVRAALAHLYFESIHPFEDGNGRIGRAVAEKALSQTLERPVLLSLSRAIEANKERYYQSLEQAQLSNEVTTWVAYFVATTLDAQEDAEAQVDFTLRKARFFDRFQTQLNERPKKVINRMFEAGPNGFEGGMNARKYISITGTSKATATRDLQQLLEIGAFILEGNAGGRSTGYKVNF